MGLKQDDLWGPFLPKPFCDSRISEVFEDGPNIIASHILYWSFFLFLRRQSNRKKQPTKVTCELCCSWECWSAADTLYQCCQKWLWFCTWWEEWCSMDRLSKLCLVHCSLDKVRSSFEFGKRTRRKEECRRCSMECLSHSWDVFPVQGGRTCRPATKL